MTKDEERFNEYIQRLAREYDPEVEVPREAIWARIEAARRARPDAGGDGTDDGDVIPLTSGVRRRSIAPWLRWGSALAAMLVLGIAIGRMGVRTDRAAAPLASTGESAGRAAETAVSPYRLAAAQHLQRTEALLAALPTDARPGQTDEVAGWAGELLTDTRLLLDSPAGQDVELGRLLSDLELVLAQIADLQGSRAADDVELIQDGIDQRNVMLRLRAATARPGLAGS